MKIFLGIHVGHNASASLMINGKIIFALQEERFVKQKNFMGFPEKSLRYIKDYLKKNSLTINEAGFSSSNMQVFELKYPIIHFFSIKDFDEYYGEKFYDRRLKKLNINNYLNSFKRDKNFKKIKNIYSKTKNKDLLNNFKKYRVISQRGLNQIFGNLIKKITFLDHHTCHAYYGKYSITNKENKYAVVVLDAMGDNINQSIWLKSSKKEIKSIVRNDEFELARIYKFVTLLLNMRPDEHEFKVMGMAPYAKKYYYKKIYNDVFKHIQKFRGLNLVHNKRPKNLYGYLKDKLRHQRFDNIAGAVQYYVEITVLELLKKIYKKYGIKKFFFSGGISMNVKMYNFLIKNNFIDKIYNAPSGADESLAIGACYFLNRKNKSLPLKNLSLGMPVVENDLLIKDIIKKNFKKNFKIRNNIKPKYIAKLLIENKIIALADGREEFGARALGNRSIIANPSNQENVQQINEFIKNRDFWMPFALTVLNEDSKKYFKNDKNLKSEFMNLSFDTKKENLKDIIAGCHPYDKTARPQFLEKNQNENFYKIIKEFKKISKIGAVLNTSLNLHGNPKCSGIQNVIETFKNSGLKYLYINNSILIEKI